MYARTVPDPEKSPNYVNFWTSLISPLTFEWPPLGPVVNKDSIEALHVTYYTVNMADCSSPFKRSVITTYHHSLSTLYSITNALVSNRSITAFCWIDYTRPWSQYWTLVQIFCLESIDEKVQGLYSNYFSSWRITSYLQLSKHPLTFTSVEWTNNWIDYL